MQEEKQRKARGINSSETERSRTNVKIEGDIKRMTAEQTQR